MTRLKTANEILTAADEAAEYLRARGVDTPEVGIILGSGLASFGRQVMELKGRDGVPDPVVIPYKDIPGFKATSVSGHSGNLIYAEFSGRRIVILSGRYHHYEGHSLQDVVFPTRVLIRLGIKRLIITNASGAINENFREQQMMLISDHINLLGDNPLIGENISEFGPRFPDMCDTYNRDLRVKLKAMALEKGIELVEGVYAGMNGPSFETTAEIRFLRTIGADAVGMSSVPEAIVANHAGLEIIGISFLSNMAAGITGNPITAEEVNEASLGVEASFNEVMKLAIGV